MNPKCPFLLALIAAMLLAGADGYAAVRYTVVDMNPNSPNIQAASINDLGQVLYRDLGMPYIYDHGTLTPLPQDWYPVCINNHGDIGGRFDATNACIYQGGVLTIIGVPMPGMYTSTYAQDINDVGQVLLSVSFYSSGGSWQRNEAWLYSQGVVTRLAPPGTYEDADTYRINNSGVAVGQRRGTFSGAPFAKVWPESALLLPQDLWGGAFGINDANQIVGLYFPSGLGGPTHAFLCNSGVLTDLGTLGGPSSSAISINGLGQVVGNSSVSPDDPLLTHAFLYEGGPMLDLNTLIPPDFPWLLSEAIEINHAGQILVRGRRLDNWGDSHDFLLTPIPEPGVLSLVGLGALLLLGRKQSS